MKDSAIKQTIQNKVIRPSAKGGILPLSRVLSASRGVLFFALLLSSAATSYASVTNDLSAARGGGVVINSERLADAIAKAENSKSHPYGILKHYKKTTPRQACLNTIKSAIKRYKMQGSQEPFISFLSRTYAPINCDNDNGTNKFWVKNVSFFYQRGR